jgi:hypothetical protein
MFVIIVVSVYYFIEYTKKGKKIKLRTVVGYEAISDLVGRATELGGKIHFTPGLRGALSGERAMDTVVGLSTLGYVGRLAYNNEVPVIATVAQPENYAIGLAILEQAKISSGWGLAEVDIRYYGPGFSTTTGILGILTEENVAGNIMIGSYGADAIIMAESAQRQGIMQIGGAATPGNLPFFMAICDYYLLGEEIYAAAALSTENPLEIGILLGEDIPKVLVILLLLLGIIFTSFGSEIIINLLEL